MKETMNRTRQLQRLKEILEHMLDCSDALQWSSDNQAEAYLTDRLLGDLDVCRELCVSIQAENEVPVVVCHHS